MTLFFFLESFINMEILMMVERLLNYIHSHFRITNEENLYTLATIVCEPKRLGVFLANKDLFSKKEFRALYNFWKRMCELMHIHSIPENEDSMYKWYEEFERENYCYTEEGRKVVEALAGEFAERWY